MQVVRPLKLLGQEAQPDVLCVSQQKVVDTIQSLSAKSGLPSAKTNRFP
jgi:hypothetical protein